MSVASSDLLQITTLGTSLVVVVGDSWVIPVDHDIFTQAVTKLTEREDKLSESKLMPQSGADTTMQYDYPKHDQLIRVMFNYDHIYVLSFYRYETQM